MRLTISGYNLLNIIDFGQITVHGLRCPFLVRGATDTIIDEQLLCALIELVQGGLVNYSFFPDYDELIEEIRLEPTVSMLVADWQKCFGTSGPRGETAYGPTLDFWVTDAGGKETVRPEYKLYASFLCKWHEYDANAFDFME